MGSRLGKISGDGTDTSDTSVKNKLLERYASTSINPSFYSSESLMDQRMMEHGLEFLTIEEVGAIYPAALVGVDLVKFQWKFYLDPDGVLHASKLDGKCIKDFLSWDEKNKEWIQHMTISSSDVKVSLIRHDH
jgi:hypothetical protein